MNKTQKFLVCSTPCGNATVYTIHAHGCREATGTVVEHTGTLKEIVASLGKLVAVWPCAKKAVK